MGYVQPAGTVVGRLWHFCVFFALQTTWPAPVAQESTNRQQVSRWPKRENRLVAPTD